MEKIVLTGATSEIGRNLIEILSGKFEILTLGNWRLGDELPINFRNLRVIHIAHDRRFSIEQNHFACEALLRYAKPGSVLLSSVSAHATSQSTYGKSKYLMESLFHNHGSASVRAGLILFSTPAAMQLQIHKIIGRLPLLPLPFANSTIYTSDPVQVCKRIENILIHKKVGTFLVINSPSMTFFQFVRNEIRLLRLHRLVVPIPSAVSERIFAFLLKIPLKISLFDSFSSFIQPVDPVELAKLRDNQ